MIDHERILKGMEVVDVAEAHVGIVEHHEGSGFRLSHRDAPDHHHHYIPHHWVAKLDERVHLARAATDVFDSWPGGYPTGYSAKPPEEGAKAVNWKAWAAVGAGAVAFIAALL